MIAVDESPDVKATANAAWLELVISGFGLRSLAPDAPLLDLDGDGIRALLTYLFDGGMKPDRLTPRATA